MYGIDDNRPVFSRAMALAGRMFIETIPQWLAVGAMLSLIFGGCCSNVFALEAIVKVEPASGVYYPLFFQHPATLAPAVAKFPDNQRKCAGEPGLGDADDLFAHDMLG